LAAGSKIGKYLIDSIHVPEDTLTGGLEQNSDGQ